MDDHTMLMERIIGLVAGLPSKSRTRVLLTDQFINELWYSLDHPVLNYIGEKYSYRSADGSNNNPLYPQMGAAGTTYARSVRPTIMAPGALPDPGLIFDTVMKRSSSGYKRHPNNVSSILWYWATISKRYSVVLLGSACSVSLCIATAVGTGHEGHNSNSYQLFMTYSGPTTGT